jgi:hypothetical protein
MATENKPEKRETKTFWAVVDGWVMHVTGYSCKPSNDYWWCPAAGYSMLEGHHLFDTEPKALDVAITEVEKQIEVLNLQHAKLVKRKKAI